MAQALPDQRALSVSEDDADRLAACAQHVSRLEALIHRLETADGGPGPAAYVVDAPTDQRLAEQRLGNAAGLFVALRCKHAATAAHGLHVALLCSAWARKMNLAEDDRDHIETASLLHDVGIIGVPDRILLKPTRLESPEMEIMAHARRMGHDIVRANGAGAGLVAIMKNFPVWYNAPGPDGELAGPRTPLGSRMIAIAEAFDSMTTDQVFRPARSKEEALDELVRCAGTQFDPLLVDQFAEIAAHDLPRLYRQLADQWMRDLQSRAPHLFGHGDCASRGEHQAGVTARFQQEVLDNTSDCVIMVDPALTVIGWNRRAEQLTGIVAENIVKRPWRPEIVEMRDDEGRLVLAPRCPLRRAVATGVQSAGRFSLARGKGARITVDAQILPILDRDCLLLGAAMVMRDVSSEHSLKRLCENLQSKATVDPLTKTSNRAEFERQHAELIRRQRKGGSLFSVTICDLDHFKQINDTYGHQAGDEVLIKTAALLQAVARAGDLVARYGGEEFVILSPDRTVAAAARQAEQIRDVIRQTKHRLLGGRRVTASFGVTQVQPGDTAETMLRRADRALYLAKDQGRNRVVRLGTKAATDEPVRRWAFWRRSKPSSPEVLAEEDMVAPGPIDFAVEKLRGFAADHQAVLKNNEENVLEFELAATLYPTRRKNDPGHVFILTLEFSAEPSPGAQGPQNRAAEACQIRIRAAVALETAPARVDGRLTDYARQVITSIRAYLMAAKAAPLGKEEAQARKNILLPRWPDQ